MQKEYSRFSLLGIYDRSEVYFFVLSFALLTGIVARNSGIISYELVLALILVTFIFFIKKIKKNIQYQEYTNVILWFKFLLLFLILNFVAEFIHFWQGEDYSDRASDFVERYLHLILIMMLFALVMTGKNRVVWFWKWLILASFIVLWVLVYETVQVGFEEVLTVPVHRFGWLGSSYFIDFGIYSNTLFISLWGAFLWRRELGRFWIGMLILALIISLAGAILSQSRTAWIGWPEALIGWGSFYLYMLLRSKSYKKIVVILSAIVILVFFVFQTSAKNVVEKRVYQAFDDVERYMNGDPHTSLGLRFLMFEAALVQIKKTPWLGIGENQFHDFLNHGIAKIEVERFGKVAGNYSFTNIHNQFLMSWLLRGVLGLISVVLIFGFLFYAFSKQVKQARTEQSKALGVLGVVFSVASFMTFMPETPLHSKAQFLFFFLMSTMFILMLDIQKSEELRVNSSSFK
jgi:O-antigen ligase